MTAGSSRRFVTRRPTKTMQKRKEDDGMKRIDLLSEEFRIRYERFMIGCDAIEDLGKWDKENYGEMEAYYQNDLVSVILRLIAADGEINDKEVRYLNENFGFDYTPDELSDVYRSCRDDIGHAFDEQFARGAAFMRSINEKIAEAYRELLGLICDIIVESDGVVTPEEIGEAKRLKALL